MTTTPVAALPIPGEPETGIDGKQNQAHHLLYTLSDKSQIGLEIRPTGTDGFDKFEDNNAPEGLIKNPASFAGIIQQYLPVVYGIANIGTEKAPNDVVSRLSPYFNPLADHSGNVFPTEHKAVSACTEETEHKYYVHFFEGVKDTKEFQLIELDVKSDKASKTTYKFATAGKESNLASLAYKDRWIFWVDGGYVQYLSTAQPRAVLQIDKTIGVKGDSPLAVSTYKSQDNVAPLLRVALYHVNQAQILTRTKGVIQDGDLKIIGTKPLESLSRVNDSSLLTLVPKGDTNYLYYKHGDSTEYTAAVDEWIADSA